MPNDVMRVSFDSLNPSNSDFSDLDEFVMSNAWVMSDSPGVWEQVSYVAFPMIE